jgi:hypothetical protein
MQHYNELTNEFEAAKTPEGRRLLQAKIELWDNINRTDVGRFGERPTQTSQRFYDYNADVNRKIEAARRAGKDPNELFNNASADYIGNNPKYRTTLQQQLGVQAQQKPKGSGDIPPRNAGEGFLDWLTRTGRGLMPARAKE